MKQSDIGVVVIGRNEGERLVGCLSSLRVYRCPVVYVDSGSDDGSVATAKAYGADTIELDLSTPFSAARARNAGARFLFDKYTQINYVQFIDGDCELSSQWLLAAREHLAASDQLVAVCGRRRERFPDKTIYNRLCDIEWDTPIGLAQATGGDFLCKKQAFLAVSGFCDHVIAGEEPELCFRWRKQHWQIERLDMEMTLHDADMTCFQQWWRRAKRSGHAYGQGAFLHGRTQEAYCVREVLSILVWGGLFPLLGGVSLLSLPLLALLLFLYLAQVLRLSLQQSQRLGWPLGGYYAVFLLLGKLPQMIGVLHFCVNQYFERGFRIIEYKK